MDDRCDLKTLKHWILLLFFASLISELAHFSLIGDISFVFAGKVWTF